MILTRQSLQERENYSLRLKIITDELCVTQAELAKAIGKDQKTVSRYLAGESYPEGCIAEIEEYLLSRCCIKEDPFLHIRSEEFDKIFSEMYNRLQAVGIHEPEFAKKIGIAQKTLNNYHNFRFKTGQPIKLSTETQYKIVKAFICYDDDELFDYDDPEYRKFILKLLNNRFKPVTTMQKVWTCLIDSLKAGGRNFFILALDKQELICFYLHKLISFLDGIGNCIYDEYSLRGSCPFYMPPVEIASLDFLREFQKEKSEFIDAELSKSGIESLTFGYCTDFFHEDTARYVKIYDTFLEQEKKDTDVLLYSVYMQYKKELTELQELFKNIDSRFFFYNEPVQKITTEDKTALTELFAQQSAGCQSVIVNNFEAFFGRLYSGDCDTKTDMWRWLCDISAENKRKFISIFEDNILKDFWKNSCNSDLAGFEYLYTVYSQYMALIAWSSAGNTRLHTNMSSEGLEKIFKSKIKFFDIDEDPLPIMETRLRFTPLDWYANMLVDIAYLKGMDLYRILFDEIGMFYDMDEYIKRKDIKRSKKEKRLL